jgi:hypothetical protein
MYRDVVDAAAGIPDLAAVAQSVDIISPSSSGHGTQTLDSLLQFA